MTAVLEQRGGHGGRGKPPSGFPPAALRCTAHAAGGDLDCLWLDWPGLAWLSSAQLSSGQRQSSPVQSSSVQSRPVPSRPSDTTDAVGLFSPLDAISFLSFVVVAPPYSTSSSFVAEPCRKPGPAFLIQTQPPSSALLWTSSHRHLEAASLVQSVQHSNLSLIHI